MKLWQVFLLGGLSGCGAAAPAPGGPGAAAAEAVPSPETLIAFVRLRELDTTLDLAARAAQMDPAAVRDELATEIPWLAAMDTARPVWVAVALEPDDPKRDPFVAVRFAPAGEPDLPEDCQAGDASVVCSLTDGGDALFGFLEAQTPPADGDADVFAEVDVGKVWSAVGEEMAKSAWRDLPTQDNPVFASLQKSFFDELETSIADVGRVALEAKTLGDGTLHVVFETELERPEGKVWQALLDRPAGAVPGASVSSPESALASHAGTGVDRRHVQPLLDTVDALLDELGKELALPAPLIGDIRLAVRELPVPDAPFTSANGYQVSTLELQVPVQENSQQTRPLAVPFALPWSVYTVEGSGDDIVKLFDRLAALGRNPTIVKALGPGASAPITAKRAPLPCKPGGDVTAWTVDLSPDLIRSLASIEDDHIGRQVTREMTRKGVLDFHVAVRQLDGVATFALAFDPKRACELFAQVQTLERAPVQAGGLGPPDALVSSGFSTTASLALQNDTVRGLAALDSAPRGGTTRLHYEVYDRTRWGGGLRLDYRIPPKALEELPALLALVEDE